LRVTLSNDFAENGEESPVRAIPPGKINGLAFSASPLASTPLLAPTFPVVLSGERTMVRRAQNEVIVFVLLANQLEIELPKIVTTPMSSTATSAMSKPYSVTGYPLRTWRTS
jgi:hypothetical protein